MTDLTPMRLRPHAIAALAILALALLLPPGAAWGKVYIDIDAPAGRRLPIAVQTAAPIAPTTGATAGFELYRDELDSALAGDLGFTQIFDVIGREAFLEDTSSSDITRDSTDFYQWRAIGADMLVKGGIDIEGTIVTVELRLFDTVSEKQLLARRYAGRAEDVREMAHRFSSSLLEKLTGEKGVFTTKLAFISDKTGAKEIYVSDYDGRNLRQLTADRSINLSPRWSPDGKKLVYVSYKQGGPSLYVLDLTTLASRAVSDRPGINIAGRWAPDGRRMALTVSSGKSPELFVMDVESMTYTQLTDNYAIDVSPTWSPDGKSLAYVSDIAGNPHIYVINSGGGTPRRLTREGKYNTDPAWSPDGTLIAFSRDSGSGGFNIWVMKADGRGERRLTGGRDEKSPAWSPDGRHIIFSAKEGGATSLYIMRSDGSGLKKFDPLPGNETDPAWSPSF